MTQDTALAALRVFYAHAGQRLQRNASARVLHDTLTIPQVPPRIQNDWAREVAALGLMHGDVEPLPLARTIMRWSDYSQCGAAVAEWLAQLGLPGLLSVDDLALMACLGTPYHHDAELYGDRVFCNLFLSPDCGMDLHFPALDRRIPLQQGTVVVFDTAQPHAVIPRTSEDFDRSDFAADSDCLQVFLTWELPLANTRLQEVLQIDVVTAPSLNASSDTSAAINAVWLGDVPVAVCPDSGCWQERGDMAFSGD